MISDKLFDFLSEFLGYNCRNPKEFNELLPTLDSLDKMDLVYRLEEKFNISIDEKVEISNFDDLIKCVEDQKISSAS